jgi:hypothetical protein
MIIDIPVTNMAGRARKRSKTNTPRVGLCSQATWINQQLDQASPYSRDSVARQIVSSLSTEELRLLPAGTRRRLREHLSEGRITDADRQAVSKLLSADLVEVEYQERMVIKGPQDFVDTTKKHLSSLAQLPIGRKLFHSLHRSRKRVMIVQTERASEAPPEDFKDAIARGKRLKWKDIYGKQKTIVGTGRGANTTIKYNPNLTSCSAAETWRKNPPEIGLAHELIHANDAAYGQLDPDVTDGVRNYERQAVGLPPYEDKEFTENRFRAAWKNPLPARARY